MFTVGGTDIHVHKYLGTETPSDADATADQPQYNSVATTNIQDLLWYVFKQRYTVLDYSHQQ